MDKKIFGFGIIGAGVIARFHARAIHAIADARLIGVYNRTKFKAKEFATAFSCNNYDTVEDLVQDKHIDIVCICTASGAHLKPALLSIRAGKHCLVEKPLEVTIARCAEIIAEARKARVKVGVIFPSRFYAESKALKNAVDRQRFGNMVLGDAYVKWYRSPAYYQSGKWRGTWELDGGGALMNQGIHSVDLLQWYMGPVRSVHAFCANIEHKSIEVEDTVVAIIEFENGALGTIECSTAVFPGSLKRIEIRGTKGSAVMEENNIVEWKFSESKENDAILNQPEEHIQITGGGASNPEDISFKGHQMQIEDMIRAITDNTEPAVNGEEGQKSVAIIEAIYKSAKTGRKISLK